MAERRKAAVRWTCAAIVALAIHVATFDALAGRGVRTPADAMDTGPTIEVVDAGGGEDAPEALATEATPASVERSDSATEQPVAASELPALAAPPPQPATVFLPPATPTPKKPTPPMSKPNARPAPTRTIAAKPVAERATRAARTSHDHRNAAAGEVRASSTVGRSGTAANDGSSMSVGEWNSLVTAQIRRNQRYPQTARDRGEQGVATVSFSVARSGSIAAARLSTSSGHTDLDAAALAAIRNANPLPPPPLGLGNPVTRNIPLRFDLR